jgi:Predicted membrane protein
MYKENPQMSESLPVGILLALSGGMMDAYSYIGRGHVFANAQTGNILLLGISLSQGQWGECLRYVCPVAAFIAGIALSNVVRNWKRQSRLHWRQVVVLVEALIMVPAAFLPQSLNLLANSLISFSCGMQVETFQKIQGNNMATTMCIGNLRSATHSISDCCFTKDTKDLYKGLLYLLIIVMFAAGAVVGSIGIGLWSEKAILMSSFLILICFFIMLKK